MVLPQECGCAGLEQSRAGNGLLDWKGIMLGGARIMCRRGHVGSCGARGALAGQRGSRHDCVHHMQGPGPDGWVWARNTRFGAEKRRDDSSEELLQWYDVHGCRVYSLVC